MASCPSTSREDHEETRFDDAQAQAGKVTGQRESVILDGTPLVDGYHMPAEWESHERYATRMSHKHAHVKGEIQNCSCIEVGDKQPLRYTYLYSYSITCISSSFFLSTGKTVRAIHTPPIAHMEHPQHLIKFQVSTREVVMCAQLTMTQRKLKISN